jgi:hypothetical protein
MASLFSAEFETNKSVAFGHRIPYQHMAATPFHSEAAGGQAT